MCQASIETLLTPDFRITLHSFVLKFISDGELENEAVASAIRDGIGRGLKNICSCSNIKECLCPYCQYFKPQTPQGMAGGVSPAFILETFKINKTIMRDCVAGLRLILIGDACTAFPWFLSALLHCSQVGIGFPHARFTVDVSDDPIEISLNDTYHQAHSLTGSTDCLIRFLSPCIIEDNGERRYKVDFPRIVKAIIERLQPNIGHWCGSSIRNKHRDELAIPLLELAKDLEWDFRLNKRVYEVSKGFGGKEDSLSGFIGTLRIRGDLTPFWPLLVAGSLVHIGLRPHLDRGRYIIQATLDC